MSARSSTAFAPATVANVAVGFDLLGFATEALGDKVTITLGDPGVRITSIEGPGADVLPREPRENTATAGLIRLAAERDLPFGFDVAIEKGIPVGSGLGGSAASAVAAVVAAGPLLDAPLSRAEELDLALDGEAVATGARHPDNVAPCLHGGLTFARADAGGVDVVNLPFFEDVGVVLVHPKIRIDTRDARDVLPERMPLQGFVKQSANLSNFLIGCFQQDRARALGSVHDVLIEPHRSSLVPGFYDAQRAAFDAGASAFSLSGSGPTVFAFCDLASRAAIADAIVAAFEAHDLETTAYRTQVAQRGAFIVEASS